MDLYDSKMPVLSALDKLCVYNNMKAFCNVTTFNLNQKSVQRDFQIKPSSSLKLENNQAK